MATLAERWLTSEFITVESFIEAHRTTGNHVQDELTSSRLPPLYFVPIHIYSTQVGVTHAGSNVRHYSLTTLVLTLVVASTIYTWSQRKHNMRRQPIVLLAVMNCMVRSRDSFRSSSMFGVVVYKHVVRDGEQRTVHPDLRAYHHLQHDHNPAISRAATGCSGQYFTLKVASIRRWGALASLPEDPQDGQPCSRRDLQLCFSFRRFSLNEHEPTSDYAGT
ncbi:hypothetical protein B566_EDAN010026 [Ephemera danica]|nr:hypothetical protein B566_EDAN010026 [Ephemera danica]